MEKLQMSKAELRSEILKQRAELAAEQQAPMDQKILERLMAEKLEQNETGTVYLYAGVRGETRTERILDWLLREQVRVAYPRVRGKEMDFYYIASAEDLEPGCFGIPEPKSSCLKAMDTTAPVIVPGVAFSEQFERTGYGAGYYDRFFAKEPLHQKIAICYEFQMRESLASEPHDIPMDQIVTEERSLKRREN